MAVCGGTLGIFLACALQQAGLRVAVLERGPLRGRAQEWNISRAELQELVRRRPPTGTPCHRGACPEKAHITWLAQTHACRDRAAPRAPSPQVHHGVLSEEEASGSVSMEFNPVRCGFHGSPDIWTRDVLNLGVSPSLLIDAVRYHAAWCSRS